MKKTVLSILILTVLFSLPVQARIRKTSGGYKSSNCDHIYIGFDNKPMEANLFMEGDCYVRIEGIDNVFGEMVCTVAEKYSKDFKLLSKKKLNITGEYFGGACSSEDAYYILTGNSNIKEDNSKVTFRVYKYDKSWNQKGLCEFKDNDTHCPFDAGSASMVVYKNQLLIHTCHTMYNHGDGKNHQSNISFQVNTDTMKGSRIYNGYVSHSFNQLALVDNGRLLTLDHGDASPRSIIIHRNNKKFDEYQDYIYDDTSEVNILKFPGERGNNWTGATAGGFECSENNYLVSGVYKGNVYVATVPRESFNDSSVRMNYIKKYKNGGFYDDIDTVYQTTHLVKITPSKFMLLWQEQMHIIQYVIIDENANKLTPILSTNGNLSDAKPIVDGDKVVWYYTEESAPIFCYPVERPSFKGTIKGTVNYGDKVSNSKVSFPTVLDHQGHVVAGEWKYSNPDKVVTSQYSYHPKATFIVKNSNQYDNVDNIYVELTVKGYKKSKTAFKGGVKYKIISTKKKTACVFGTYKRNLTSATIENRIKIRGKYYKITEIRKNAFAGQTSLKKVTIGNNVKKIGDRAFFGCKALSYIRIKTTRLKKKSSVKANAFTGLAANCKVKVPKGKKKVYKKILKKYKLIIK